MALRTSNQSCSKAVDAVNVLGIVTAEGVPKLDKEFPKSSSPMKVDGHHPNSSPVRFCFAHDSRGH